MSFLNKVKYLMTLMSFYAFGRELLAFNRQCKDGTRVYLCF